jgi:hypothetical protein
LYFVVVAGGEADDAGHGLTRPTNDASMTTAVSLGNFSGVKFATTGRLGGWNKVRCLEAAMFGGRDFIRNCYRMSGTRDDIRALKRESDGVGDGERWDIRTGRAMGGNITEEH